jgi:hypothetical protein
MDDRELAGGVELGKAGRLAVQPEIVLASEAVREPDARALARIDDAQLGRAGLGVFARAGRDDEVEPVAGILRRGDASGRIEYPPQSPLPLSESWRRTRARRR